LWTSSHIQALLCPRCLFFPSFLLSVLLWICSLSHFLFTNLPQCTSNLLSEPPIAAPNSGRVLSVLEFSYGSFHRLSFQRPFHRRSLKFFLT
jgi:hypothetical protein